MIFTFMAHQSGTRYIFEYFIHALELFPCFSASALRRFHKGQFFSSCGKTMASHGGDVTSPTVSQEIWNVINAKLSSHCCGLSALPSAIPGQVLAAHGVSKTTRNHNA